MNSKGAIASAIVAVITIRSQKQRTESLKVSDKLGSAPIKCGISKQVVPTPKGDRRWLIQYQGSSFTNTMSAYPSHLGADAVDAAIAKGIDLDGTPISPAKLDLYHKVMALEAQRQRSGVTNTMRSRIVRIGAKHIAKDELNQMLNKAGFAPLKEKEIAFYYQ